MRRLLMSRLIRIFTVCLVYLIFIPIIQKYKKQGRCPYLDDCPNLPDFTLSPDDKVSRIAILAAMDSVARLDGTGQ